MKKKEGTIKEFIENKKIDINNYPVWYSDSMKKEYNNFLAKTEIKEPTVIDYIKSDSWTIFMSEKDKKNLIALRKGFEEWILSLNYEDRTGELENEKSERLMFQQNKFSEKDIEYYKYLQACYLLHQLPYNPEKLKGSFEIVFSMMNTEIWNIIEYYKAGAEKKFCALLLTAYLKNEIAEKIIKNYEILHDL